MLKQTAFVLLIAILITAGYFWYNPFPQESATRRPDFNLPDLQGKIHSNIEWDGKVVILNFWATWCPPCIKEIPLFIQLQEKYAAHDLQFVGIAVDHLQAVQYFVKKMNINYPILLGQQEAIPISINYGNHLGALPFTAIIDKQGHIVLQHIGKLSQQKIEDVILPLLVKKAVSLFVDK